MIAADEGWELALSVDADPAVWLAGPGEQTSEWEAAAHHALLADLGVGAGSAEATYLAEVLNAFAEADLGPFRFLRLRSVGDVPVVARLDVALRDDAGADPLLDFEDELPWYDHHPVVEVVDEALGLRRASRLYVDDGVRVVVRHHRALDLDGTVVDAVVSCAGYDMVATATALNDLAALLAAVTLTTPAGRS